MTRERSVGVSVPRRDGPDKVTGQARFLDDLPLGRVLYAKVLRSPHPHARVLGVDSAPARQVPGVVEVVTARERVHRIGECIRDHVVLARDVVRYVGEPIAVVMAHDELAATRGVEAIEVAYEPLPAVTTVDDALAADAPLVHPDLGSYQVLPTFHPEPGTNVYHRYVTSSGDVDLALAAADVVLSGRYEIPHISHGQLEPHGAVALWTSTTDLTVWCSAQSPHLVRKVLAEMFGLPLTSVRVVVPYIGGGFGGKSDTTVEPLAALAARAVVGRPVRLVLTREEMFSGSVLGRGATAWITTAASRDGTLLGAKVRLAFACGAYGDYGINVVEGAGHVATGTYRFPAFSIEALAVYTNTPFIGAFRGYGHPEVHWAMERHMDHLADQLGVDPVALRRKNLLRPGDSYPSGQPVEAHHGDLVACLDHVAGELASADLEPSGEGKARGVGICPLMKAPVMATNASSAASLRMNPDGTVELTVGGTEMGQGAWTALAQIAAEALEIPVERVRTVPGVDTATHPYEWQTVGSTTTWKVGRAVRMAADALIDALLDNAALGLGVPKARLEYSGGVIRDVQDPDVSLDAAGLALNVVSDDGSALGGPVAGYGYFTPRGITWPDEAGKGNLAGEWTYGCQGALVEVDLHTGEVEVLELVTALDVGRVVNPALARGQVVGAMAQGLGAALMERVVIGEDGQIRNDGFTDYKIPAPEDLEGVRMKVSFLETPFPEGPFGARCLAEHGLVSVPPAIAAAVRAATGVHVDRLPITPEDVLRGILGASEPGEGTP